MRGRRRRHSISSSVLIARALASAAPAPRRPCSRRPRVAGEARLRRRRGRSGPTDAVVASARDDLGRHGLAQCVDARTPPADAPPGTMPMPGRRVADVVEPRARQALVRSHGRRCPSGRCRRRRVEQRVVEAACARHRVRRDAGDVADVRVGEQQDRVVPGGRDRVESPSRCGRGAADPCRRDPPSRRPSCRASPPCTRA